MRILVCLGGDGGGGGGGLVTLRREQVGDHEPDLDLSPLAFPQPSKGMLRTRFWCWWNEGGKSGLPRVCVGGGS